MPDSLNCSNGVIFAVTAVDYEGQLAYGWEVRPHRVLGEEGRTLPAHAMRFGVIRVKTLGADPKTVIAPLTSEISAEVAESALRRKNESLPCGRTAVWGHPHENPGRRPENRAPRALARLTVLRLTDNVGHTQKITIIIITSCSSSASASAASSSSSPSSSSSSS